MARRSKAKKRRNRGGGGGGGGGSGQRQPVSVAIITPPSAPRAPGRFRRGTTMARSVAVRGFKATGRGIKRAGVATYAAVSGDLGVQIACEAGELTAALVKGAMDMISQASETTADDTAFPLIQKAIGSGMRALGDLKVAKKHPALAKVMSAFGSSMSGTVYLDWLRAHGIKAQVRLAERLQK